MKLPSEGHGRAPVMLLKSMDNVVMTSQGKDSAQRWDSDKKDVCFPLLPLHLATIHKENRNVRETGSFSPPFPGSKEAILACVGGGRERGWPGNGDEVDALKQTRLSLKNQPETVFIIKDDNQTEMLQRSLLPRKQ